MRRLVTSRLIRIYTVCHCVFIYIYILADCPIWNNGCVQIQRWKSPLRKLWDERGKILFYKKGCSHNIYVSFLMGADTLSRAATIISERVCLFCVCVYFILLENGSLLPSGGNSFYYTSRLLFKRRLLCRNANRKSQKIMSFLKIDGANLPRNSPVCTLVWRSLSETHIGSHKIVSLENKWGKSVKCYLITSLICLKHHSRGLVRRNMLVLQTSIICSLDIINIFLQSGLYYPYKLDESIYHLRDVCFILL